MDEMNADPNPTPLLFNDVYAASHAPCGKTNGNPRCTWSPFPRLPAELRVRIWLSYIRRHRMIEVDLFPEVLPDGSFPFPTYTDCNHLGRIVSGGLTYSFALRGRGAHYAAFLSPLLSVNHESREVARSFYHVHLPFPGREQVLYLSPEYDAVYLRNRAPKPPPATPQTYPFVSQGISGAIYPGFDTILVDFLHDARAYDYKDQGITHLALDRRGLISLFELSRERRVFLTPRSLRVPAAAESFAEILGQKLRSVFCLVDFQSSTRGMSALPWDASTTGWRQHFAQTFPLHRHGRPAGGFAWLAADPRPGVELDLRQLPLSESPQALAHGWRQLPRAFGVAAPQLRVYICPAQPWPTDAMLCDNNPGPGSMYFSPTAAWEKIEAQGRAPWSRARLETNLRFEAALWRQSRNGIGDSGYFCESPEEEAVFEAMEKVPCTAIGWWLFPAEALQPVDDRAVSFRASVRPGLFLFDV